MCSCGDIFSDTMEISEAAERYFTKIYCTGPTGYHGNYKCLLCVAAVHGGP